MPGDAEIVVSGDDNFTFGVNSFAYPGKLTPGEYVAGLNLINRGGVAQTRPGSASLPFEIEGTNLQGITMFRSTSGQSFLVFMVDGLVYYSGYPFKTFDQMYVDHTTIPKKPVQFNPYSKYAAWANCVQSTFFTPDGILDVMDAPRNILIIQDGSTRAAYWDGAIAAHIDPTPSGLELTPEGKDGTPVGLWMKWSNNRLWVSRDNMVFASDAGNPLKFTERQYLAEARAFYLPGPCTGITETYDQQGIMCFTPDVGVFLKTSVQDRTTWLSTPDFQRTVMPDIGCVAPRSIILAHGLIWWWTTKGLINQNDANKLYVSSRIFVQDQKMAESKSNLSYDISGVAGTTYENFILYAVPNGDKLNTRVHVMDQAPFQEEAVNSWPSYWEGWRPVEFARGIISSQERLFCLSRDYDGKNRIWEMFLKNRTDNGIPITSYLVTRSHFFENRDYKKFRYAEAEFIGISGKTAVMIAASGMRGGFQSVGKKDISSQIGQIYHDQLYGETNDIFGTHPQTRVVKTTDTPEASTCNSACVESDTQRGLIDKSFSLLIVWSGIAGLSSYRILAQGDPTAYQGICENDETDETRMLTSAGCGSNDILSAQHGFTTYFSTATFSRIHAVTGLPITNISTQSSIISQEDANRKASAMAKWYVENFLGEVV